MQVTNVESEVGRSDREIPLTRFERAAQMWAVLAIAARNRQILTYEMMARACGVPRPGVGGFLEPIQDFCLQEALPPLTALVVGDESGMPGIGFIAASDIPRAQADVFNRDWLVGQAPSPQDLEAAFQAAGHP